jgi:hypothetical protein
VSETVEWLQHRRGEKIIDQLYKPIEDRDTYKVRLEVRSDRGLEGGRGEDTKI